MVRWALLLVTLLTAGPAAAVTCGPCPPVSCTCPSGAGMYGSEVTVGRCPEWPEPEEAPPAPVYVVCRRLRDGSFRCPRTGSPQRLLMPEPQSVR